MLCLNTFPSPGDIHIIIYVFKSCKPVLYLSMTMMFNFHTINLLHIIGLQIKLLTIYLLTFYMTSCMAKRKDVGETNHMTTL